MTKDVLKGRSIVRKNVAISTNDLKEDLLKLSISEFEEPPEVISEKEISLTDLSNEFHKNLDKGFQLLESFGLKPARFFEWFKLGFTDKSIEEKLSIKQKEYLTNIGLFDLDGKYIFDNCLIIPTFNENDEITGFVGIDKESNVKTIGNIKGLLNHKALKVFDEIIITERILSALSLMETGFDNVVGIEGSENITGEIIRQMKDNRIKTVIIAFEDFGNSNLLKDILLLEDFKVKQIFPPMSNSWNKLLRDGISKKEIEALIEKSKTFPEVNTSNGLTVKKDGSTYIFIINEITYRLFDVKEIFVTNLKVSIKANYGDEVFPDKVDLYSSRSRNSYSLTLSKAFNVEPKRIEKDLISIIEYLEKERDKKLGQTAGIDEKPELTDEERQIGLEFLKSENLFDQIIKDMEILGYVGEDLNKLLLYIAASTRILDDPISVMIISQSAAGKSYLVETLRKLLPPEDVIALTSLSDQALNYISNMLHKFLILGEAVHNELIEHQIREILSNKELSRLVTTKDDKTGKMVSISTVTKTIVSMVLGGTRYDVNPENASRFFIVNADESIEQTGRIHELQKEKHSLERRYIKEDVIPVIIKKHQNAQRLLQKVIVVNPFRSHLKFPSVTMRARRDFERFIDLIAGVCFLRQFQKELKDDGRFKYIECDLTDYKIAYDIMTKNVLPATMTDIPKSSVELYEVLRKMAGELSKKNGLKINEVRFTQREIREYTGFNQNFVKLNIRYLVEYEYVTVVKGGDTRTRGFYRLKEDENIKVIDLSMIPKPEDIELKLQKL